VRAPCSTLVPYTTLFRSLRSDLAILEQVIGRIEGWAAGSHGALRLAQAPDAFATVDPAVRPPGVLGFIGVQGGHVLGGDPGSVRSEEHTSELQSPDHLVC